VNVDTSVVVPVVVVKVTGTPVCQFDEFSVTEVALAELAVLPVRARLTVTGDDGAALSRSVDVPLPPDARFTDVGEATTDGCVVPPMLNETAVLVVLSDGEPLSYAVAVALWLPDARPVALTLYGAVLSVATRAPSTRNSTRVTAPPAT
jgi:hypothetical protein